MPRTQGFSKIPLATGAEVRSYDALVIGVGGMGAAALAHLARRGLSVLGIEEDDVPNERGSSVGETRVIRKAYFEDARYVPLLERAYTLWRELEIAAGEPLFVRSGCVTMGPPEHEGLRGVLASVTQHRLPHRLLSERELRAAFPAIVPTPGDIGVLEEDAGYLHVEACTRAHARWAIALGAELRTRTRVAELVVDDEVRAVLGDGSVVAAPRAVLAAGPWLATSPALRALTGPLPLAVERQVQLWFAPPASPLPAFIHFTGADRAHYAITTPEAIKVCRHHGGESTTPDAIDRALRQEDEDDVRGYLRAHLPSVDGPPLRSRVCMYTNTPDHHFVVGPLARRPNVVLLGGFSGHGYKMASVIGEVAAQLITGGGSAFDLAMFDPTRPAMRPG